MKPKVAIYTDYLPLSMTFIYRQLLGVQDEFSPIILAPTLTNLDIFPFSPIFYEPKTQNLFPKIIRKLYAILSNEAITLSFNQANTWQKLLSTIQPRLIHAHFGPSGLQMLPLARSLEIPLLVTFHGYDVSALIRKKPYRNQLQEMFAYSYNIAISNTMKEQLLNLGANPEKTYMHYIGVPLELFTFQKRDTLSKKIKNNETISFLQISNFVEKKGHRYTIDAFSNIIQHYPNCKLVLAGDGLLRPKIETLVKAKKIQDKVLFLGRVTTKEVIPLMHHADIFLHHSVTASDGSQEGIPTVLMEAMGTGLPVFSTYHAGISELIEDEKTGYLSPEKDIQHFTRNILKFINGSYHPGKNASNAVHKRFNMAIQNHRLKQIYREIANE